MVDALAVLAAFAAVATLVTFDLLIVFVFVADFEVLIVFVTVTFFLTCIGAFLPFNADLALDIALEIVVLTDVPLMVFLFLLRAEVDSSNTLPNLRFVPASAPFAFF